MLVLYIILEINWIIEILEVFKVVEDISMRVESSGVVICLFI